MKRREKRQFGPDVFERKRLKETAEADAVFLRHIDKLMKKAFTKVDRTRPQWEICVGCHHFRKRGNAFFCTYSGLAPTARAYISGRSWTPKDDPPWGSGCPRIFYHLSYTYGETLPEWNRQSLLRAHHGVFHRKEQGIILEDH